MKRILALRTDRFGEFLLIIPALRVLKEAYPESKIVLAVSVMLPISQGVFMLELALC